MSMGGTAVTRLVTRYRPLERLEGVRFGRLVVLRYAGVARQGHQNRHLWLCRCDCDGNEAPYREDKLKMGWTRSCGCLVGRQLRDGAGLSARERVTMRLKGDRERALRGEEVPLVEPWRRMLRGLLEVRAITHAMLAQRCGWKYNFLYEAFFHYAARPPSEDEAALMALALNLRGQEKADFMRLAREAREAVARKRRLPRAEQVGFVNEIAGQERPRGCGERHVEHQDLSRGASAAAGVAVH